MDVGTHEKASSGHSMPMLLDVIILIRRVNFSKAVKGGASSPAIIISGLLWLQRGIHVVDEVTIRRYLRLCCDK